jgi:hypothetical protein
MAFSPKYLIEKISKSIPLNNPTSNPNLPSLNRPRKIVIIIIRLGLIMLGPKKPLNNI